MPPVTLAALRHRTGQSRARAERAQSQPRMGRCRRTPAGLATALLPHRWGRGWAGWESWELSPPLSFWVVAPSPTKSVAMGMPGWLSHRRSCHRRSLGAARRGLSPAVGARAVQMVTAQPEALSRVCVVGAARHHQPSLVASCLERGEQRLGMALTPALRVAAGGWAAPAVSWGCPSPLAGRGRSVTPDAPAPWEGTSSSSRTSPEAGEAAGSWAAVGSGIPGEEPDLGAR